MKRYIKLQKKLKELYRKQADIRKYQHECLASYIVLLGNRVYVEKMNFKGLQKRSTKTEKNDKCNERFETFLKLYNLEVERLKGKKNLSSIAI